MDLLDVLRRQAGRFQCPSCGKSMADCRLDLMARTELESLVRITCAHCAESRLVAVAVETAVSTTPVRDEPIPPERPAITVDEILDLQLALREHQGDLKSLIKSGDRPEKA